MKIEKISDNQIRCTLSKEDLSERELKLSELAYGTEKARELFHEMMQQASFELGFEAENMPLMVEAIPISSESIVLLITKVDDPEELDTRFSKFAPATDDDTTDNDSSLEDDDIASLFNKIQELRDSLDLNGVDYARMEKIPSENSNDDFLPLKDISKAVSSNSTAKKDTTDAAKDDEPHLLLRAFSFESFDKVSQACEQVHKLFHGNSALYKDVANHAYYLFLSEMNTTSDNFNIVCNTLSEFGMRVKINTSTEGFYKEHFETIIRENAISVLGNL